MWFIGVEVEQKTSAPPPNKNPGSAPVQEHSFKTQASSYTSVAKIKTCLSQEMSLFFGKKLQDK